MGEPMVLSEEVASMDEILEYLISYCSFLYERNRFRFVDSMVSDAFGGDSLLVLASEELQLRFVRDRGQLFLDFRTARQKGDKGWYSIDLVRQLITGEREYHSLMNEENARFLKENLDTIEQLFSERNIKDTLSSLKELRRKRSKRLSS